MLCNVLNYLLFTLLSLYFPSLSHSTALPLHPFLRTLAYLLSIPSASLYPSLFFLSIISLCSSLYSLPPFIYLYCSPSPPISLLLSIPLYLPVPLSPANDLHHLSLSTALYLLISLLSTLPLVLSVPCFSVLSHYSCCRHQNNLILWSIFLSR